MDCPGPNSKRDHQHTGHSPARDHVEGGVGVDRHPSTGKPPDTGRLTRVQGWKRDRDVYNGFEAHSRTRQHRPFSPLPCIC